MQFSDSNEKTHKSWIFLACIFVVGVYLLFVFGMANIPTKATFIERVASWHDQDESMSIDDVIRFPEENWTSVKTPVNLGLKRGVYWFKFSLSNNRVESRNQLLEINHPLIDQLDVWFLGASSTHSNSIPNEPSILGHMALGDKNPFAARSIKHDSFVINLDQYKAQVRTGIMRIQASSSLKLPMRIWQGDDFLEYSSKQRLVVGIFFGFLIAMAISNLFFFLTTKNTRFLFYTCHVLCFSLVIASLFGYGYQYLWPSLPWFQEIAVVVFANATMLFAMFFTNQFLDLKVHSPKLSVYTSGLGWFFLAITLLSFVIPFYSSIRVFFAALIIALILVFTACIKLSLKNIIVAKYYTFAWSILFACALAVMFENIGIFMLPGGINSTLLYAVTGETFFLAFVLAISYRSQKDEIVEIQAVARKAEQETAHTKDKLLEIQQSAQEDLEYKVQERTLELEVTLRELSDANSELERINTIDPLTGIRNRRHFEKRITAEGRRSRREKTNLCLVMLDIDFFKRVNDEHGHHVGDECLKHIASLAKSFIKRPSDDLCRYGGEEFALILPNTTEEGAVKFVDAIRQAIASTPCLVDGKELSITISAGVASGIVEHEQGERDILKYADKALYQAKENGRNQVCSANNLET